MGNVSQIYKNGLLTTRYTYDSQGRLVEQSNGIKFIYDDTGVVGMIKDGEVYFYEKDAQGNITSILDIGGVIMVRYEYDAWGNHKVFDRYGSLITNPTHIGILNPIRYRSYYYDTETGLYYLNARYYDPAVGRFISADDIEYLDPETINGLNLYAYCGNNPVMNIDPTGHSFTAFLIGFLIFGSLAFGATAYADYKDDGQIFNGSIAWYDYLGATLFAGLTGGFLGLGASAFSGMSFSFGIPTLGITTSGGALAIGVTGTITITITGAQILTGLAVLGGLGGLYLFSYNGKWPGDDPTKAPSGFEWRGSGKPGTTQGNWYNPKTGEILHPDLNHPKPIGPHWDFRDILKNWWRIFKNGKLPK